MRPLPPLPAVRAFEAAARHENFTLAAGELGMTQAAVSYQIRLLEERLGVPLFIRSKRGGDLRGGGRPPGPGVSDAFLRVGGGVFRFGGGDWGGVWVRHPPALPA